MGVPDVTLAGETMASRRGATILNNMRMHTWITETPEKYINAATSRTSDVYAVEELWAGLRLLMSQSPITNGERYTRPSEAAYREIWPILETGN